MNEKVAIWHCGVETLSFDIATEGRSVAEAARGNEINKTNELICAHSAWVVVILLSSGIFGVAGWLPLLSPSMSADALVLHFEQHRTQIRIGMTMLALSGVFWWSFSAAIAMQMKRIEGASHPFTYVQMASASGTAIIIMLAAYFWLVAAYREDMPASTLRMMNDFAWLTFIGFYPPGLIQNLSIGLCILTDRNPVKIYPRWVGFANFWLALLFLPGALLPFFHSGPFSWNGIIGFWLVAICFFSWIIMMWWMTVRAIKASPDLQQNSSA